MELEADGGGTRILIGPDFEKTELGRGRGFASADRTVSRRHVSLQLTAPPVEDDGEEKAGGCAEGRVSFEVLGRNPVVVFSKGGSKKLFRRWETGELSVGDRLSLSLKQPIFFSLKSRKVARDGRVRGGVVEAVQTREKEISEQERTEEGEGNGEGGLDSRFPSPDVSHIDPVKEFGFIARGHEFDGYQGRIKEPGKWNWFLREWSDDSDREEDGAAADKRRTGVRTSKRRGEEDEEWTGDSEDEKMVMAKSVGAPGRPGYLTRSGKRRKSPGDVTIRKNGAGARKRKVEEEDEEDESLGGFIVDDNEKEEAEQDADEAEETDDDDDFEDEDDDDDGFEDEDDDD